MVADKSKRDLSIDFVKGLCVLCVILGHSGVTLGIIPEFWYTFYMSAFFLFSGYLFSYKETLKKTVWNKTKSLYILYLIWTVIPWAVLCVGKLIRGTGISSDNLLMFGKIILGLSTPRLVRQMWFLIALFTVEMMWIIIDKLIKNKTLKGGVVLLLGALGAALNLYEINISLFRIGTALILLPIFALGVFLKRNIDNKKIKSIVYMNVPTLIISALVWEVTSYLHFKVLGFSIGISTNQYGIYPIFYFNAILGTLVFWNIARILVGSSKKVIEKISSFFTYFGTNSTIVYVTLQILVVVFKKIFRVKFILSIVGDYISYVLVFIAVVVSEIFLVKILKNDKFKFLFAKF